MDGLRILAILAIGSQLAGCGLNSSVAISPTRPKPMLGRAVLVFAVERNGEWLHREPTLQLDQYNLIRQSITGNCLHFEHAQALTPPKFPNKRKYFAFLVPPGAFVYSRFNGIDLKGPPQAFILPAGRVTYVGDFIYDGLTGTKPSTPVPPEEEVTLRSDLTAAEKATQGELFPAKMVAVAPPRAFLCTP